jgi:hypothetical protein
MVIMATSAATDIEINPGPQTPKSRKMNPFHTPTTNSPNTKENVSTPRRTKLFNTLKSLSVRRGNRGDPETNGSKSLGRRKSAWDLFTRLSQKGTTVDDQSVIVAETLRIGTVSPFRESLGDLKLSGKMHLNPLVMEALTRHRQQWFAEASETEEFGRRDRNY